MEDNLDKCIKFKDLNRDEQTCLIFDDFMTEKDQSKMKELVVKCRHKNCDFVYISQSYFRTPKIIRDNCDVLNVFHLQDNREVDTIGRIYCGDLTKKQFRKMYDEATSGYNFLTIIKKSKNLFEKYRMNWNGFYIKGMADFYI